jgi:hypothetical protein
MLLLETERPVISRHTDVRCCTHRTAAISNNGNGKPPNPSMISLRWWSWNGLSLLLQTAVGACSFAVSAQALDSHARLSLFSHHHLSPTLAILMQAHNCITTA